MHTIPETGFIRLPQVLSVIPVGKTCWWEGVRSGRFPKPVKLSARCTAWRAEDIRDLIKNLSDSKPLISKIRRYDSRAEIGPERQYCFEPI